MATGGAGSLWARARETFALHGEGRTRQAASEAETGRTGVTAFSELAAENPAESIAHENEIVAHIAEEPDYPERFAHDSIEAQLRGLIDPDEIRRH